MNAREGFDDLLKQKQVYKFQQGKELKKIASDNAGVCRTLSLYWLQMMSGVEAARDSADRKGKMKQKLTVIDGLQKDYKRKNRGLAAAASVHEIAADLESQDLLGLYEWQPAMLELQSKKSRAQQLGKREQEASADVLDAFAGLVEMKIFEAYEFAIDVCDCSNDNWVDFCDFALDLQKPYLDAKSTAQDKGLDYCLVSMKGQTAHAIAYAKDPDSNVARWLVFDPNLGEVALDDMDELFEFLRMLRYIFYGKKTYSLLKLHRTALCSKFDL